MLIEDLLARAQAVDKPNGCPRPSRRGPHTSIVMGHCSTPRFSPSSHKAVAELYDAVAEAVLVEELEVGAHVGRQCGLAPTEDDWPDEQLELVDQSGHESLCCEVRATHKEIPTGGCFQVVYRTGVEVTFEPGVRGGRRGQARGVDDLVRRLPHLRVVGRE